MSSHKFQVLEIIRRVLASSLRQGVKGFDNMTKAWCQNELDLKV